MSGNLVRFPSVPSLFVVDTWPVMEWLKGRQPAYDRFNTILSSAKDGNIRLLMSSMNLGELYYNIAKEWNERRSIEVLAYLEEVQVESVHPGPAEVIFAARLKARFPISYADAFAATLAIHLDAPVLTGDEDFLLLQKAGLLAVEWIGA